MTRSDWISILAQARPDTVARLAACVEGEVDVEITRAAATALLLATVREAGDGSHFHPGEILVTTCEVRSGTCLGQSVILGSDSAKAQGCAVLDAALQQDFPSRHAILAALLDERERRRGAERAEEEMVRSTLVRFDTMDPQR